MKTHVYVTRVSFRDGTFCWDVSPTKAKANGYRAGWKRNEDEDFLDCTTVKLPVALWSRYSDHISTSYLPGPVASGKVFW